MGSHRWLVVALALVAAIAFALSVQAGDWWHAGEVAIGPFGAHHCFGGDCRTTGLGWLGGDDLWMRSAVATRVAGLVAMFVLVIIAGAVAAKRVPRLFARITVVSLATAAVCGTYFYVRFPGVEGAALGFGVPLYALAIAVGAAAAIITLRAR